MGVDPVNDGLTPIIPSTLLVSESGFRLGPEMDTLLGMDNVFKSSSPNFNYPLLEDGVPEYDSSESYKENTLLRNNSKFYRSLVDTTPGSDLTDDEIWEESSVFGEYIRRRMEAAALQTVSAVLRENGMDATDCKPLLVESPIYLGAGKASETIQKHSRFVGYTIQLLHANSSFTIRRFSTQLTLPQTLKIYLYSTDQNTPLKTWDVVQATGGNMEEHKIEPFTITNGFTLLSGTYRIGYYEDDLIGFAIHKKINLNPHCSTCRPQDYNLAKKNRQHIVVHPFYVPVDALDQVTQNIWDEEEEDFDITESNFGFNLWVGLACDLTDFIVQHKAYFVDPYVARLKANFLREISINNRGTDRANHTRSVIQQIGGNARKYNQDKGPKILDDDNEAEFAAAVTDTVRKLSGHTGICFPESRSRGRVRVRSL